jgi:tRNA threonylcarbamoyladenosine biosynthesis protein TsaE
MLCFPPKGQLITTLTLHNEDATAALAEKLSAIAFEIFDANGSGVIALHGDLGTGKTSFARSFISAAMGGPEEVPSPTFTLVQLYETPAGIIHHFDLYRLKTPDDALELGIEDAFCEGISLIEWPGKLGPWLPRHRLDIKLKHAENENMRTVSLSSHDPLWQNYLTEDKICF